MTFKIKPMLIICCIGFSLTARTQNNQINDSKSDNQVIHQEDITVTEDESKPPAPLQSESVQVNNWDGSTSFTTAEVWQNQRATNIKDILNDTPGVFVQQRNGAESARLSIRGSGLGRQFQGGGLLLMLDGIPLNTADGSFDFQAIDPWLIDYTTVYRGANGMAQGGSTLGGVINLGSTIPNNTASNKLRTLIGSFNTQRVMTELNMPFSDATQALRLRASHFNQAGFRTQNQQHSNRLDLQYANKSQSGLQHRANIYHLNTYAQLPSSLSKALINEDPRQSRGFNINGNFHRNMELTRVAYGLDQQAIQHHWSAQIFHSAKRLINPVFTYIERDSEDIGLNFNWQSGPHQFHLTAQWGEQDEKRFENESGQAGDLRLTRTQQAKTTTASYQFKHSLLSPKRPNKLSLSLGIQGIYAERNINELTPSFIATKPRYSQLNPRIGLMFEPDVNTQWFTNLSHSFEPPTFSELNNGNRPGINKPENQIIEAQSADTFELGVRGFYDAISWDVSLYYSELDNEFIRFRFPNGDTKTTNADKSIHQGIEAGINWQLSSDLFKIGDQLNLINSYQFNQFRLDKDPTYADNKIPGIPDHYTKTQVKYSASNWSIAPNIEWVRNSYYVDLANSYRTDNYMLIGLSINYTSPQGFDIFFDAKNLNNQSHIATSLPIPDANGTDGNYFYSGEGRSFYAGINWHF